MTSHKNYHQTITRVTQQASFNKRNKKIGDIGKKSSSILSHSQLKAKTTFFNIRFFEVEAGCTDNPVDRLTAGKQYKIVLNCLPESFGAHQKGMPVSGDFDIFLKCHVDVNVPIKLNEEDFHRHYTRDFIEDTWMIIIPEDIPTSTIHFQVSFLSPEMTQSIVADVHSLPIQSDKTLDDSYLLTVYQFSTKPPENTAVLVVSPHPSRTEGNGFQIEGWSSLKHLIEQSIPQTMISVRELMRHKDRPGQIWGKIRMFSEDVLPIFQAWLSSLYTCYREDLTLVFIDLTNLEIPWEMLELNKKLFGGEAENLYIGTLMKVARWLPPKHNRRSSLQMDAVRYEGFGIAYVDENLGSDKIEQELQALELTALRYQTLDELETRMRQSLQQVGFIYVGCHGMDGTTLQMQHPNELTAAELAMIDNHEYPRPLAFINACDSARIMDDMYGNRSFVEIFLHHCVSGYIGTLGSVGTMYASHVIAYMLTLSQLPDALSITEILRRLREEAVGKYSEVYSGSGEERKKYYLEMLYAFLYVYYGNPFACLRLRAVDSWEEGTRT